MVALLSIQALSPRLDALRKCLVMCAGAKPVPLIKARLVDVMLFCSITSTSIFLCSLKLETFTHVRDWFCGGRGARVREAGFDGGGIANTEDCFVFRSRKRSQFFKNDFLGLGGVLRRLGGEETAGAKERRGASL